jgi:hypothetical protein
MIYYLFDEAVHVPDTSYIIVGVDEFDHYFAVDRKLHTGDAVNDLAASFNVVPVIMRKGAEGDPNVPTLEQLKDACKKAKKAARIPSRG